MMCFDVTCCREARHCALGKLSTGRILCSVETSFHHCFCVNCCEQAFTYIILIAPFLGQTRRWSNPGDNWFTCARETLLVRSSSSSPLEVYLSTNSLVSQLGRRFRRYPRFGC